MVVNSDLLFPSLIAGAVFLVIYFFLQGGKNSSEKKEVDKKQKAVPSNQATKNGKAKPKEVVGTQPTPAAIKEPKPAEVVPKEAAKPVAPAPAPLVAKAADKNAKPPPSSSKNVASTAPEVSMSGSDAKLKKTKETPEQKEARLQRQQTAKQIKKEAESSARALPEVAPLPRAVVQKPLDDEWELVVDKKKDKPKKKVEEVVVEAPMPVPKPVAPPVMKETRSVNIESKRVGSIIGPKGVMLRQIQETTGTDIQIPRSDPECPVPSVSIAVTGPSAGVSKALSILVEIAETGTSPTLLGFSPSTAGKSDPQPTADITPSAPVPPVPVDISTLAVKVESKKMGVIIGPKGATLHAIQDATGTEINTTTANMADVTSVVITGPAAGVAKASKAISELSTKGYCMLLAGSDFQESFVSVPPRFLAEIIGKSGATIRAIQDHTGARVVIPPSAPRPGADRGENADAPVRVGIAGTKEGIAVAKQIITQITEMYYHPVTHPGFSHLLVDVPEKYYNFVIGTKGSEIRHIQNNFRVSVKIPDRNTLFQSVLIVGEATNCENASRYISKIVSQAEAREVTAAATDHWGDDEEVYDEDLSRYIYPRQNRNKDEEEAPQPAVPSPSPAEEPRSRPHPVSERPPGFSPISGSVGEAAAPADHGAVPLNWGPVKSTMTW